MSYSVNVSVEGIRGNYCLTDSDLRVVFGRFGDVLQVFAIGDGRSATITYANHSDAQRAINELDGKLLAGVNSAKLRVCWNLPTIPSASAPGSSAPAFTGAAGPFGTALRSSGPFNGAGAFGGSAFAASGYGGLNAGSSATFGGAGNRSDMRKYTCRFEIPIENDKDFQIARRVIGKSGANMKRIVATTDAKLRLRGRGSGYLEGYNRMESPEPLHLCVSAPSKEGYDEAVLKVGELLEGIFREYAEYCVSKQWPVPSNLKVVVKENPMSGQPLGSSGYNVASNQAPNGSTAMKSPPLQPANASLLGGFAGSPNYWA